jgi:hypothetical protein
MGAFASLALAIGSALFLLGMLLAVVLCLKALREGSEFEAEITARSFRLHIKPVPKARIGSSEDAGRRLNEDPTPLESQHARPGIDDN